MLSLYSTLAIQGALEREILPAVRETLPVRATFDPTAVLRRRIDDGERPDVIVAVSAEVDRLRERGLVWPGVAIASTRVGLAVPSGCPRPDLSTVPSLIDALTKAESVAYSRTGASGLFFARLLETLGIADEVNATATIVEKGFTGLALLDGRADLAVQQLSELMLIDGINIAGALPGLAQHRTEFSAACFVGAFAAAPELLRRLSAVSARHAYIRAGLES